MRQAQDPTEPFDVVDPNDRVIGRESRAAVHRDGLRHRAVHVLVFDRDGNVLLQKRSLAKDTFPGCWDSSCSGHVDAGESYDTAARRELAEELGIRNPPDPVPLFKLAACPDTGMEFIRLYRIDWSGPVAPNPAEIDAVQALPPRAVDQEIDRRPEQYARSFVVLWKRFRRRPQSGS